MIQLNISCKETTETFILTHCTGSLSTDRSLQRVREGITSTFLEKAFEFFGEKRQNPWNSISGTTDVDSPLCNV